MDMNDLFGDYQNGNYSAPKTTSPVQENNFSDGGNQKVQKVKAPKAKKKGGLGVLFILVLIIAIVGGGFYTYAYTDLFKSPRQLMGKYAMKMIETANNITPLSNKIAEKNTGTSLVDGKVSFTDDIQDLEMNVKLAANYDEKMSEFTYGATIEGQELNFVVVANENQMGITSNLLDMSENYEGKEYIGIKNENLKNFVKKFEVDAEILKYIPDTINFSALENLFTEAEIEDIKTRYFEIINSKLTDEMFTVEDKVNLNINGNNYQTKKIVCKMDSLVIAQILKDALMELKTDTVILESYKKVVDIQLPKDKVEKAFDEMTKSLDEIINENSGSKEVLEYLSIALYTYKGDTIQLELQMLSSEGEVNQEITYSIVETQKGYICISEAFTPESGTVPALTQTTTMNIENSPTNQKITVNVDAVYDDLKTDIPASDSLSFMSYENSSSSYVYEIKDFSDKGYSDSLVVNQEDVEVFKFTSKVKFDEDVTVTTLSDSNTVYLNDLSLNEMTTLLASAMSGLYGGAMSPLDDTTDDLFYVEDLTDAEDDLYSNTIDDDIFATEDEEIENTVTPDLVVSDDVEENKKDDAKNTLGTELSSALLTCKTEAGKTDYVLADYLIVENLKNLCPSIDTIEPIEGEENKIVFSIVDVNGYEYEYNVMIDAENPDESFADLLSQF